MIKHDSGKQRWDFIPFDALNEVVKVYTWGHEVKGYGPDNWKTVEPRDRYFAALMRHIHERRSGATHDHESGLFIWAHVIFNAMCLLWFDMKNDHIADTSKKVSKKCLDYSKLSDIPRVQCDEAPECIDFKICNGLHECIERGYYRAKNN